MADISMCAGEDCEVKETCYRFKATPSKYRQSYIKPDIQKEGCDYYWNYYENEKHTVKNSNEQLITRPK